VRRHLDAVDLSEVGELHEFAYAADVARIGLANVDRLGLEPGTEIPPSQQPLSQSNLHAGEVALETQRGLERVLVRRLFDEEHVERLEPRD
jgi:hypothetical protein